MDVQVTLFDKSGVYKPVSVIVKGIKDKEFYLKHSKEIKAKAIVKICQQRGWTKEDLIKFGYITSKVRIYDKKAIEKKNQERYKQIKKERGWTK